MAEVTDPQVVSARRALLDALEALGTHRDAVILVGAQAVYLHTGGAEVALAEFTTDADLAVDPSILGADPLVQEAMAAGGFTADPDVSAIGTWRSRDGTPVDLLVPDAVAGSGRRSAKVPPHGERAMRRAVGLEAVLVDHQTMNIGSFEPHDSRWFTVKVAGPAALLIAKLHKVAERVDTPARSNAKDAHDIYRLLVAIDTATLVSRLLSLVTDPIAGSVTRTSLQYLDTLFAAGVDAPGSVLAGEAEQFVGDPAQVALQVSILAHDLAVVLVEGEE
jgi:hypothetical protein